MSFSRYFQEEEAHLMNIKDFLKIRSPLRLSWFVHLIAKKYIWLVGTSISSSLELYCLIVLYMYFLKECLPDKQYQLDKPLKKRYFSFSRSTTTAFIFGNNFKGFLCLEFWRVSAAKYYYLIHTRKIVFYFLVPVTRMIHFASTVLTHLNQSEWLLLFEKKSFGAMIV